MLEGNEYRLTEQQTTVIPPLCYHTLTANKRGRYRRVTVLFDASAIPEELRPQIKDPNDLSVFFSSRADELRGICQKGNDTFYRALADALMIQVLYEYVEAKQSKTEPRSDLFLQEVISYIDRHLCEKISLDDLARTTSRSKSSFCHLFEEKMKISPKQYILQKKLALANKLIREGTPPTIAAIRVGYENYSNFYRVYRKHFEKNPMQTASAGIRSYKVEDG